MKVVGRNAARATGLLSLVASLVILLPLPSPSLQQQSGTSPAKAESEAKPADPPRVVLLVSGRGVRAYAESISGLRETLDCPIDRNLVFYMSGENDATKSLFKEIASNPPKLVIAIGPWALSRLVRASLPMPVLYVMVLNPMGYLEGENPNVGGVSMNVSIDRTIELFEQLKLGGQRVGVFSDPATTGYLMPEAIARANAANIELVVRKVQSIKDTISGLDEFLASAKPEPGGSKGAGLGAIWVLPSQHVVSSAMVNRILLLSLRRGIPVIGSSPAQAQRGALVSLSQMSNKDVGRQVGEMANDVLRRRQAGLSRAAARSVRLVINTKIAKKINIELPERLLNSASEVIP